MIYAAESEVIKSEIAHVKADIQQEQDWINGLRQSIDDLKGKKDRMGVGDFCQRRIEAGQARIKDLETDLAHLNTLLEQEKDS